VVGHRHPPDDRLELDDAVAVEESAEVRAVLARGLLHDLHFVGRGRVLHQRHEHEAVELRLGQRVGALLLDRVLRREHEERLGQVVGRLAAGDAVLLHRLEQGGLRLGRGAVDLVGQHHVGEQRALDEAERPLPVVWSSSSTAVPVMSEGMRSGVNCTRLKPGAARR
jgi:hypothetical protein